MKRILLLLALALCFSLTACSNQTGPDNADSSEFRMVIQQNSGGDIWGLHYEYSVDGKPIGGGIVQSVVREEVLPIKVGEEASLRFDQQGFPEDADLSKLSVELYVVAENGEEIKVENEIERSVAFGEKYFYELTGTSKGYSVSPTAAKNQE